MHRSTILNVHCCCSAVGRRCRPRMAYSTGSRGGNCMQEFAMRDWRRRSREMVVHGVRIDVWTPGLRLHTTSRRNEWVAGETETNRQTTRDFLRRSATRGIPTVLAINADAFAPWPAPFDQPTPTDLAGLAVAEGTVVSKGSGSPSLVVRKTGVLSIEVTGPDTEISEVRLAVSGFALCLDNGEPISSGDVSIRVRGWAYRRTDGTSWRSPSTVGSPRAWGQQRRNWDSG